MDLSGRVGSGRRAPVSVSARELTSAELGKGDNDATEAKCFGAGRIQHSHDRCFYMPI